MKMTMIRALVLTVLAAAIPLLAQERIVPHVVDYNGAFYSTIIVENKTGQPTNYQLTPYNAGGQALTPVSDTIGANTIRSFTPVDLFAEGEDVTHFQVAGSDISTVVTYRIKSGAGGPAHVRETNVQSKRWRLYSGEWASSFDGFAVVNMGDQTTDVQVIQRNFDGTAIQTETALSGLAPKAKGLYVIGAPGGSAFAEMTDTYFEVVSDQRVAITVLRGTVPGAPQGFLWVNEAVPIPDGQAKAKEPDFLE